MAGVSHHMATSQDTSVDRIGIFVSIASVKCSAALSQSKVGVLTKRKKNILKLAATILLRAVSFPCLN